MTGVSRFRAAVAVHTTARPIHRPLDISATSSRRSIANDVNLLATYEFSPALKLFGEGKYVHIDAFTLVQPSFDFFTQLAPDNYYLKQRFGNAAPIGALVSRDNFDLGVNTQSAKRDTYRSVVGFEGTLTEGDRSANLHYDVSYVYGRPSSVVTSGNSRVTDRYYAAVDAVADPVTGSRPAASTCRVRRSSTPTTTPAF